MTANVPMRAGSERDVRFRAVPRVDVDSTSCLLRSCTLILYLTAQLVRWLGNWLPRNGRISTTLAAPPLRYTAQSTMRRTGESTSSHLLFATVANIACRFTEKESIAPEEVQVLAPRSAGVATDSTVGRGKKITTAGEHVITVVPTSLRLLDGHLESPFYAPAVPKLIMT
uniref:SFRICE_020133 n=1 Tax=Spodoptera frugiperda TaxID=7108 RepID=A0A2H1VVP9_SPOFR